MEKPSGLAFVETQRPFQTLLENALAGTPEGIVMLANREKVEKPTD